MTPEAEHGRRSRRPWTIRLPGGGTLPVGRAVGLGLIVISSLLYAGLLAVPFLPLSLEGKAAASVALVVAGEAAFWTGGALLGRELVSKYRRMLDPRRWLRRTVGDDAPRAQRRADDVGSAGHDE